MKNLTRNFFAGLALVAALPFLGLAQLATQSTTTTAAISAPNAATPSTLYDTFYVTSTTGMLAQTSLGTIQTWLYLDKEAAPVIAVPSTTSVTVARGSGSYNLATSPGAHVSGVTVLFGPFNNFVGSDPSGSCVSTNYQYLPLVATATGHLINCDSISSTAQIFARTGSSYFVNPAGCGILATTTATTDDGMVTLAAGNAVRKLVTNTTAGTTNFTCPINPPSDALANGKGIIITSVSEMYGVQGTGGLYTSTTSPIIDSVTYAAAGGTAKGTVTTTACGTLTQTPASLVTAVTTSGVYNTVNMACGTPFYANSASPVSLVFDFLLGNTTTALTYQLPGLVVYYDQPL
jgi:hypothetical protein